MTNLHFSAEAIQAAYDCLVSWYFEPPDGSGAFRGRPDRDELVDALRAALAHDAERRAREIIEQRVAALTDDAVRGIVRAAYGVTEHGSLPISEQDERTVRAALLRALTERV